MIVYRIEDCINGKMSPFDKPVYTSNKDILKKICEDIYNREHEDELVEDEYIDEVEKELLENIREENIMKKEVRNNKYPCHEIETEIIEKKYPHIIYRKNNTIYVSRFYYSVDECDSDYKSIYCKNIVIEKIDVLE